MIFFVLIKNTQGNLKKIHGPLGPPQKCLKNCIFSLFQHFLAFLDSLDTLCNYNLATLAYNLPPEKNRRFWEQNVSRRMILVVGSKFATKKPLHVKSQKFEFYISWRGLFKQLWVLYFRLCAISLLSAVCSCAWLLLSKVIYHLKVHAYFDPHDNIQASGIMYRVIFLTGPPLLTGPPPQKN